MLKEGQTIRKKDSGGEWEVAEVITTYRLKKPTHILVTPPLTEEEVLKAWEVVEEGSAL